MVKEKIDLKRRKPKKKRNELKTKRKQSKREGGERGTLHPDHYDSVP